MVIRDVIIIGAAAIPSVLGAIQLQLYVPAALTAVYAFLSVRPDDPSVLDYIKRAVRFFLTGQQFYIWKET